MSHVSIVDVQGVTVVRVRAHDEDSSSTLLTELADALTRIGGDGGEDLIIDLGSTNIDDDTVQLLVKASGQLKTSGHRLIVVSGDEQVRATLAQHPVLNVSESLDAAAGDMAPAYDPNDNPAEHQRGQVPPLDARGF